MKTSTRDIIFYVIDKREGTDLAYFADYGRLPHEAQLEAAFSTAREVPDTSYTYRPQPKNSKPDWSFVAEPGCNRYLFAVTDETDAYFDASDPVECFVPHLKGRPTDLLQDIKRISAKCVAFTVDTKHLLDCIEASYEPDDEIGRGRYYFSSIPVYFNLKSQKNDLPMWLAANHRHVHAHAPQHAVQHSHHQSNGHSHGHAHSHHYEEEHASSHDDGHDDSGNTWLGIEGSSAIKVNRHGCVHFTEVTATMIVDMP